MTDSGGIQEEAYVFAKPIMVLRDVTERMEAVNSGYAFLTGIQKEVILEIFEDVNEKISDDFNFFLNNNPFGDGRASEKILKIIANDSCSSKT
jgi:UDP-N-acetylglucosamine 2-epimerase (non-hydrolysing)